MRRGGPARLGLGPARFHSNMQIGDHIEITMVASWADGLCPVLPPLSDILVLRLTRSSCGVYKTVIGMCSAFLSLILLRIRVNVLHSRA